MKKQILTAINSLILIVTLGSSAYANSNVTAKRTVTASDFRQAKAFYNNNNDSSRLRSNEVSRKAIQHFNELYKNSNPSWQRLGNNFLATLVQDNKYIKALFAPNGFLYYHISSGSERDMPGDVRRLVKSTYFDYTITSVKQVTSDNKTAWLVNMQDDRDLVIIKVVDNQMEEVEQYTLSK